ncbi:MAG: EF-hand domain-containing protein [Candidatus Thiodiazotropha sp. 6PLUC2]
MKPLRQQISFGLLFAIVSSFSTVSLQSEEIPARGPIPFGAFDLDGNNLISEEEFNTVRGKRMASAAAEGRPMRGAATAPSFTALDANSDGQLNQQELTSGQRMQKRSGMGPGMGMGRDMPSFSDFDLNGDGLIVEKEFAEARTERISNRAKQGYMMRNLSNAPQFVDIDTNRDGVVSVEEFAAHQSQRRQKMSKQ